MQVFKEKCLVPATIFVFNDEDWFLKVFCIRVNVRHKGHLRFRRVKRFFGEQSDLVFLPLTSEDIVYELSHSK